MTLTQIRKRVSFWQEVLNLREWTIVVRWGKGAEIKDCVGRNFFSVEELLSEVVLSKKDPPSQREETLVHELLHLVFDGHKTTEQIEAYDALHERALNKTAKGLMTLAYPAEGTE